MANNEKITIAIAKLVYQNDTVMGYRLFNTDGASGQYKDLPIEHVKLALQNNMLIENMAIFNGEIKGTQGDLSRLPIIKQYEEPDVTNSSITILFKIENEADNTVGYIVCDLLGRVKLTTIEELVQLGEARTLSNGKVVVKDSINYISAINGTFKSKKVNRAAKMRAVKKEDVANRIVRGINSVVQDTAYSVKEEIEYSDVFNLLNKDKRETIQEYFVWRSISTFEGLAKSTKLEMNPRKVAQLADIRSDMEWRYSKCRLAALDNPLGYDYCTLGHRLQYVHYAVGINERGETATVKFGATCAADFFDIDREGIAQLNKVTSEMGSEINWICDVVKNDKIDSAWKDIFIIVEVLNRCASKKMVGRVFGEKIGEFLVKFLKYGIPFTESLVKLAVKKIHASTNEREFWEIMCKDKDLLGHIYEIDKGYDNNIIRSKLRVLLKHTYKIQLEGIYSYDPINKIGSRGPGRFTQDATRTRKQLNYMFENTFDSSNFTLGRIDKILELCNIYYSIYEELEREIATGIKSYNGISQNTMIHSIYDALETELNAIEDDEEKKVLIAIMISIYFRASYSRAYQVHQNPKINWVNYSRYRKPDEKGIDMNIGESYQFIMDNLENIKSKIHQAVEYSLSTQASKLKAESERREKEEKERNYRLYMRKYNNTTLVFDKIYYNFMEGQDKNGSELIKELYSQFEAWNSEGWVNIDETTAISEYFGEYITDIDLFKDVDQNVLDPSVLKNPDSREKIRWDYLYDRVVTLTNKIEKSYKRLRIDELNLADKLAEFDRDTELTKLTTLINLMSNIIKEAQTESDVERESTYVKAFSTYKTLVKGYSDLRWEYNYETAFTLILMTIKDEYLSRVEKSKSANIAETNTVPEEREYSNLEKLQIIFNSLENIPENEKSYIAKDICNKYAMAQNAQLSRKQIYRVDFELEYVTKLLNETGLKFDEKTGKVVSLDGNINIQEVFDTNREKESVTEDSSEIEKAKQILKLAYDNIDKLEEEEMLLVFSILKTKTITSSQKEKLNSIGSKLL